MHPIDWIIIGLYFCLSFVVAVYFSKRSGKNIEEFFLSGRRLPWWIAGTSMVATTFATDTPLAVTELVAKNGIAGNWLWWNFILGGMLTVVFFARLWRRAGVVTDVEFIELRYSGQTGAFLRGFRALYLGLFINVVVMGWVNLAMISILEGMFGIPRSQVRYYVFGAMLFVAFYSALAGLWGVAFNDAIQFVISMTGTTVLMFVVLRRPEVGGISGLQAQLPDWVFRFTPVVGVEAVAGGGSFSDRECFCGVHFHAVVGLVVPGIGAGRGRVHCTENAFRQGRKARPPGNPVVHDRPLLPASLALDPGGTVDNGAVSGPGTRGEEAGIHLRDA